METENLVVYNLSRSKINGHIKVHSIVYNTSSSKINGSIKVFFEVQQLGLNWYFLLPLGPVFH
jgi:hypothetical protein